MMKNRVQISVYTTFFYVLDLIILFFFLCANILSSVTLLSLSEWTIAKWGRQGS